MRRVEDEFNRSQAMALDAENKALIEQTKSDAKVIAELNVAIADRNLEIEGDMKMIAALMQALKAIAQRSLDDPNTPAYELGHIAEHAIEQIAGDFKCSE